MPLCTPKSRTLFSGDHIYVDRLLVFCLQQQQGLAGLFRGNQKLNQRSYSWPWQGVYEGAARHQDYLSSGASMQGL
jgi:hypothetical protein